MTRTHRFLFVILIVSAAAFPTSAQVATGIPPFGSFGGGPDVINLANLNAHLSIPVLSKSGRGTNFTYTLAYDSAVWHPVNSGGNTIWQGVSNFGWSAQTQVVTGYVAYTVVTYPTCYFGGQYNGIAYNYNSWWYYDTFGTVHYFPGVGTTVVTPTGQYCSSSQSSSSGTAEDGSGWTISVTGSSVNSVISNTGQVLKPPVNSQSGAGTFKDRNGNELTANSSGQFFDTLSSTVPVLSVTGTGSPSSPRKFTYTAPSTGSAAYSMIYAAYTVQTKFGCSGISEYGPTSNNLVSEIDLPDIAVNPSDKYTFTYEVTPNDSHNPHYVTGRLASVTLPTGGTITYAYTGGSSGYITCADGSAATLTRTTPDGTWTYAQSKGTGAASTTLITDPAGNQTNMNFQGTYVTERQAYSGSTSGTLLHTWVTCYNGNASNCNSTAITLPITQQTVTDQYGPSGLQSEHNYLYNSVGGLTEEDDYDYGSGGPGALLRKTLVTYASLGNITAFRQQVTIKNGSGTTVSQTNYNYDETTPTSTSGIAQHVSVTGSRGNLTSIDYPVNGPISRFTYYDTGSLSSSQDINLTTATYNYSSNLADCQMGFPTSITEPIGSPAFTQSYTWSCTGGVLTQLTDENGNMVSTSYTDQYFWRPGSVTDQTSVTTKYCYAALSAGACPSTPSSTQIETYLNFNSGNSTADSLTTLDGLGRVHIQQTRQSPSSSNFDSVETDYDALGRVSRVSVPYVGTAAQACSSCAATSTTYDALSRPSQITDGGEGTTAYTYSPGSTDTLIAIGPAPSGENLKQRQLEYDGLGRLTSVCELTSLLPGNGNCAQNTSQTGYLTQYTYDALGNLLTVTQDAQASSGSQQARSYVYDAWGRLTSETNPETAQIAVNYTYDYSSSCASTSYGDLVKRVDAIGNITCYAYDALHRPVSISYTTTGQTVTTPTKYFVYDTATVNNQTMQYAKTRLAEAYTGPSSAKITDEGFSYTKRGELTNVYELTPHSSPTYYNASQTYWANGAPNVLGGNIGLPTSITYGADGEGRSSTVSASSGGNPVTSTTYNLYASPYQLTVALGSGDSDVFTYDPNTFRMNKYQFNVDSQTVTGTLGWNANWSLGSLGITDPFSTANTQSCSFAADDVARISQVNCGTIWGQNFSYDPFGNIQKNAISGTGGSTFTPCYQTGPITNRIALVGGTGSNCSGGAAPSYDANGNSLNDTFRTFTWDAENRPVTMGSVGLTYDALGRVVERGVASTYTETVYSPAGAKLALMNGTTLTKAFVPLTGGDTVVYNSSGPAYYRHTDHLGSSRFASTPSQTLYSDTAYSPFGEPYASSGAIDNSFTGQDQDTLAGLYDFPAREQDPNQGRWASPDPAGLAAVDPTNPQSWNRYAYVQNSPLNLVDPFGRNCVWDDGSYDSSSDPDTGNQWACENIYGGTWLDPSFFSDFGLADWSGSGDAGLETVVHDIQAGYGLVQTGSGENGWLLVPNGGTGLIDWSFLGPPVPPLSDSDAAILAIHNGLKYLPQVCSIGVSARIGKGSFSGGFQLNTDLGSNTNLRLAVKQNLFQVGKTNLAITTDGVTSGAINASAPLPFNPNISAGVNIQGNGIAGFNVSYRASKLLTVSGNVRVANAYDCP